MPTSVGVFAVYGAYDILGQLLSHMDGHTAFSTVTTSHETTTATAHLRTADEQFENRSRRLVGAMTASQLLDTFVSRPRELKCDMYSASLVLDSAICLQRDARRRCIGQNGY